MPQVSVRTATTADAAALHAILNEFGAADDPDEKVVRYRERLDSTLENPMHKIVVAELDGVIVGYAAAQDYGPALNRDFSSARMHDLWVSPAARGHGAGSALFDSIRSWAANETSIRFLEWQASEVAVGFYRTLGLEGDGHGDSDSSEHFEINVHLPGEES